MVMLVIGSALRAVCGDQTALGLRFIQEARTAPRYRLFALDDRYAALVDVSSGGISVPGELVELDDERWPELLATEPEGIEPGPVELDDGRIVTAALGDAGFLGEHGVEITEHGGFEAYLRAVGKLA
jgi:gamma-glutamylcyclotransferase (GGCT)/AIG2-like uncharacterized protein YtfP